MKNQSFHIQVHPLDSIDLVKSLLSDHSNLTFSQGDITENLIKAKILVSTASTLIFDMVKIGKPSIAFFPFHKIFLKLL